MNMKKNLQNLISYKTINNPSEGIYPGSEILNYVESLIRSWYSDFQVKVFYEKNYSSIYFSKNIDRRTDVLFLGHLDVVPISDGWKSDPFELHIESGLGYGRGAKDCKGSVLSALLMLKRLCEDKNQLTNRIGFYFSLDEESGGKFGSKLFFKYLKVRNLLPKFVINVDGGTRVVNKRRGGFGVNIKVPPNIREEIGLKKEKIFKVRIIGDDSRHSAYFVKGCDTHPLISLSKFLHLNRELKLSNLEGSWVKGNVIPDDINATLISPEQGSSTKISYDENLTKLVCLLRSLVLIELPTEEFSEFGISVNPNIVSYSLTEGTEINFDVRAFLHEDKTDTLIESFKNRLVDIEKIADVSCTGSAGYFHTPANHVLVKIVSEVLKSHRMISIPCEQEGASDARYASKYGVPVIDLGPLGGEIHGSNEWIDLDSLDKFALIYEEIIRKLVNN
jgi:succinyl-diaminopimelate desuccinylase